LIAWGVRRLLLHRPVKRRERAFALVTIAVGYLVYLLGVYSKENSLCLLVFAPFLLKWLGGARCRSLVSQAGRVPVLVLGSLLVGPLLHVATRLALAVLAG